MEFDKKIFILDPAAAELESVRAQLQGLNPACRFEADTAPDRALVRIVRWQPDLLIAGIDLGNITGFDLCEILRLIPDCAFMSIILICPGEESMYSRQAMTSAADLFVPRGGELVTGLQKGINKLLLEPEAARQLVKRPINKVLVVDDSRIMRRIISTVLTGIGIRENIEAEDGVDGLKRLTAEGADMVLADYTMPRMNGINMVKHSRKNDRFENLPIVLVTAEGEDEIDAALRAGANGYIKKPFTMQQMHNVIARFAENVK
jgi:two-component system chemotaxis response regulator CheY